MNLKWVYFSAAALFASYLLVSHGAPLVPVIAGCVAVAGVNLWRHRSRAG